MAVTSQQIIDFLTSNPGMTDAQIVAAMEQYGVSPAQMASAVGLDEGAVASRVAATVPQGQTITLGDTIIQPVYQTTGSGMDQQVGGLENVITYKATDNRAGGAYTQYTPTGEVEQTGTQQEVKSGLKEFALGAGLLFGLPTLLNAGAAGAPAIGNGAFLGEGVASGIPAFDTALANATVGSTGLTAAQIAQLTAQDLAIGAGTPSAASTAGLLSPAVTSTIPSVASATNAATALTPSVTPSLTNAATTAATALTPTAASVLPTAASLLPTVASALSPTATNIAKALIPTAVSSLFTPTNVGNLLTSGAQTAAGLLQQQTSREAAVKAQQMIDAETAAAKQSAAFRPIGMTTRFGTSQFQTDPVTGQLTSAGYTLSPEAKNAQDRFLTLAGAGLTQAEQAQQQFAPLQTGAQNLFNLGNQYIAQSPQAVAQNYLNQQMALLQPGRETELANLQNRLQQQGRGGLSVAQGGTLGATTPELQALYNARAQQEAQLAANAQQFGQQQVQFGAGLLGTGAQTMGQYYGGQQAAYAPFTSAFGQMQALEAAGQQPFQLGVGLGKETSTAGYNVGRLGLTGAGQSVALATGADATRNPYASAISGFASNPAFAGLFSGVPPVTAMSALPTTFGTGNYYGSQDLGLYL